MSLCQVELYENIMEKAANKDEANIILLETNVILWKDVQVWVSFPSSHCTVIANTFSF